MPSTAFPADLLSPRRKREARRIRRAGEAARAHGGPAMTTALAQIEAAFDEAAAVSAFKTRVEELLKLGPCHPAVRARFGARADMLAGRSLDGAIAIVERCWRNERTAFRIASAFGCATRLSLEVLRELRLILRLMRLQRRDRDYDAIVMTLRDEQPFPTAAE
jgi:hypothetical protein